MVIGLVVSGTLLIAAAALLLFNLGGAADTLTRRVTSRRLGTLAPGYAADPTGLKVYGLALAALGLVLLGSGVIAAMPLPGAAGLLVGGATFVIASVVIVAGEVRVYRSLPPEPPGR